MDDIIIDIDEFRDKAATNQINDTDDLSPDELVQIEQGREKLILLLDDFESRGGAPVDWLLEQLNIE
jgi:hypothetical protein